MALSNKKTDQDDAIKKWETLSSTIIFEHPRMVLAEDEVKLPTGKIIRYIHQVYRGNGGVVVVCIKDGKLLVQQEYSYPVNEVLYQFPGGRIEEGETYIEAAKRELAEESRLLINEPLYLGWFYPDNRRTDAKLHVMFCNDAASGAVAVPDETEFIKNMWLPVEVFKSLLQHGKIHNYAMLAAWAMVNARGIIQQNEADT